MVNCEHTGNRSPEILVSLALRAVNPAFGSPFVLHADGDPVLATHRQLPSECGPCLSGATIPGFRCCLLSPSNSPRPSGRRQTPLISVKRSDRTVLRPSSLLILVSGLSGATAQCSSNDPWSYESALQNPSPPPS